MIEVKMRTTRPGFRLALVCSALLALLAVSTDAYGDTHFTSFYSRIPTLTVAGTPQYHIVAQDGVVYSKPATGMWARIGTPSSGPLYGYTFGPTGLNLPSSASSCTARLFAVGTDGQVWELTYCGVTSSWSPYGSGGAALVNNPPITAAYLAATNTMVVATVDNATGHLWILRIPLTTEIGTWSDVSGSIGPTLDVNAAVEVNTDNNSGNADVWGVSSMGDLEQYRLSTGSWTDHGPPATGLTATAEGVASHFVTSSQYNVFVIASDLTLRVRHFNGTAWSWGGPLQPPGDFVSGGRNSLAYPTPPFGSSAVFIVGGIDGKLWGCAYAPSTASCTWVFRNHAPDNQGSTAWGLSADLSLPARRYRLLLNATINTNPLVYSGVTYVNAYNLVADQWETHLAPVDSFVTMLSSPGYIGEYSSAEFFGTVIVVGQPNWGPNHDAFYWSSDDGNSWSAPSYPLTAHDGSDVDVSFDANGIAYATKNGGDIITSSSFGAPGSWSPVYTVPGGCTDRPYMVADWRVGGRVYYACSSARSFSYCANGAACANSTGAGWCGPYPTVSTHRAFISLGGDGSLYFASDDSIEPSCPVPVGFTPYTATLAVRHLPNVASLSASPCADAATIAARWSPPECLFFAMPTSASTQTRNGGLYAAQSHDLVTMDAPRDTTSGPIVLHVGYTDTLGNLCGFSSTNCRADVFAAWRRNDGTWSGYNQTTMLRVNQDAFACGPGSCWVDHILPVPLAFDYGLYNASWMDWREDSSDIFYHLYSATITGGAVAETAWPLATRWWDPATTGYWIGEFHRTANARLHGHQVGAFGSLTAPPMGVPPDGMPATAIVSAMVR